jgi:hypothetical protein
VELGADPKQIADTISHYVERTRLLDQ